MLRITPTAQQWAALEQVRLETQHMVAKESSRHEAIRSAQARMFRDKRRSGYISLSNTLIEAIDLLVKTEPRVLSKVEANIERLHLTAKISEICPVLASR